MPDSILPTHSGNSLDEIEAVCRMLQQRRMTELRNMLGLEPRPVEPEPPKPHWCQRHDMAKFQKFHKGAPNGWRCPECMRGVA